MANELRTRTNFVGGLVEDNPLTNVATTLTSAGLAALPVIDTTNHAAIILDPDGIHGAPEIVWVTAHSASSTTATILRAQESTSARQHLRDTYWVHTATVRDFAPVYASVVLTASQNISHNTETKIQFNSVEVDTLNMWDSVNFRFDVPMGYGGWWKITGCILMSSDASPNNYAELEIYLNNNRIRSLGRFDLDAGNEESMCINGSALVEAAEGDTIYLNTFQNGGETLVVGNGGAHFNYFQIERL